MRIWRVTSQWVSNALIVLFDQSHQMDSPILPFNFRTPPVRDGVSCFTQSSFFSLFFFWMQLCETLSSRAKRSTSVHCAGYTSCFPSETFPKLLKYLWALCLQIRAGFCQLEWLRYLLLNLLILNKNKRPLLFLISLTAISCLYFLNWLHAFWQKSYNEIKYKMSSMFYTLCMSVNLFIRFR